VSAADGKLFDHDSRLGVRRGKGEQVKLGRGLLALVQVRLLLHVVTCVLLLHGLFAEALTAGDMHGRMSGLSSANGVLIIVHSATGRKTCGNSSPGIWVRSG
jgi:hypothetical protein